MHSPLRSLITVTLLSHSLLSYAEPTKPFYDQPTIASRYTLSTAQSIPTGGATKTIINFDTMSFDTTGAVATGAAWHFTAPMTGIYHVSATVLYNSAAYTVTNQVDLAVYRTASNTLYAYLDYWTAPSATNYQVTVKGSTDIFMSQGDQIDLRTNQASGSAITLNNCSGCSHIEVSKVAF